LRSPFIGVSIEAASQDGDARSHARSAVAQGNIISFTLSRHRCDRSHTVRVSGRWIRSSATGPGARRARTPSRRRTDPLVKNCDQLYAVAARV